MLWVAIHSNGVTGLSRIIQNIVVSTYSFGMLVRVSRCFRKTCQWVLQAKHFAKFFVTVQEHVITYRKRRSRDSAVGIAIGYGLDDRRVGVPDPVGSRIFSSPRRPDQLWGHSTSDPMGTEGFFPGG
jgi:hypothetical protein